MGAGASGAGKQQTLEVNYPRQSIAEISRQSKLSFVAVLREVSCWLLCQLCIVLEVVAMVTITLNICYVYLLSLPLFSGNGGLSWVVTRMVISRYRHFAHSTPLIL